MTKIRRCGDLQHGPIVELFPGLQTNTEREPQTNAARYSDGPSYADIYADMFGRPMPHSVRVQLNGDSDGGDLRQVKPCPQTNKALDSDEYTPTTDDVYESMFGRPMPQSFRVRLNATDSDNTTDSDDGGDVPSTEEIRKQILGR